MLGEFRTPRPARASGLLVCLLATIALAIGVGGCGESGGAETGLTASEKSRLLALVDDASQAAGARDQSGTRQALSELEKALRSLLEKGRMAPAEAMVLLRGVEQAHARVSADVVPLAEPEPESVSPPSGTEPAADEADAGDKGEAREEEEHEEEEKDEKEEKEEGKED